MVRSVGVVVVVVDRRPKSGLAFRSVSDPLSGKFQIMEIGLKEEGVLLFADLFYDDTFLSKFGADSFSLETVELMGRKLGRF